MYFGVSHVLVMSEGRDGISVRCSGEGYDFEGSNETIKTGSNQNDSTIIGL